MSPVIVELLLEGPNEVEMNKGIMLGTAVFAEIALATATGSGVETVES